MRPRARRRAYGALAVAVAVLWSFPRLLDGQYVAPSATGSEHRADVRPGARNTGQLPAGLRQRRVHLCAAISLTVTLLLTVAVTLVVAFLAALAVRYGSASAAAKRSS